MTTRELLNIQLSTIVIDSARALTTTTRPLTYILRINTPLNATSSIVELEITDERDSTFLFNCRITETEFVAVRAENNLAVDFSMFPDRLVDQFHAFAGHVQQPGVKLGLELLSRATTTQLTLFQETTWNKSSLLTLKVSPATEKGLIEHLSTEVAKFKELYHRTRETLTEQNNTLLRQYEDLRSQSENKYQSTESRYSQQLSSTKEEYEQKLMRATTQIQQLESELRRLQADYDRQKAAAENEIAGLKRDQERERDRMERNHSEEREKLRESAQRQQYASDARILELTTSQTELEASLKEMNKDLNTTRAELTKAKSEVEALRSESRSYNATAAEVAKLESALAVKSDLFERVEQANKLLQMSTSQQESRIRAMADEINKGNDVIQRLQNKLRLTKAAVTQRDESARHLGDTLKSRDDEIAKLKIEVSDRKSDIITLQAELKNVKHELETRTKENQHTIQQLDQQANLTQYLQKMATEKQMTLPSRYTTTAATQFMPTTGLKSLPQSYSPVALQVHQPPAQTLTGTVSSSSTSGSRAQYRRRDDTTGAVVV